MIPLDIALANAVTNAMPRGIPTQMNYSTYEGASELAMRLDDYWHRNGFATVKHQVVPGSENNREYAQTWTVRGNLVAGLPPGVRNGRELRFTFRKPYQQ